MCPVMKAFQGSSAELASLRGKVLGATGALGTSLA